MKRPLFFALFTFMTSMAFAVSNKMTVSGRLLKPDGTSVTSSSVVFEIKVLNPAGSCSIYREQLTVDLSASDGLFELALGSGTQMYGGTLSQVFDSTAGAISCEGGSSYSPAAGDTLVMQIKFYDNNEASPSWRSFTSSVPVRSVPQALHAEKASKLGNYTDTDFLLKPTSCSAGNFVSYDGTTVGCSSLTASSISSGTFSDSFLSSISVDKIINGTSKYFDYKPNNVACANGEILKYTTGTGWTCASAAAGTVTSVTATAPVVAGGTVTAPVISMAQATSTVPGYLASADWTTFNGKQAPSAELDALSAIALTGILQRTGAGTYTTLGVSAPLLISGGNIGIANAPASLITSGTFADAFIANMSIDKLLSSAGKYFDYKPNGVACATGEILKYTTGTGWVCATASAGSVTAVTASAPLSITGTANAPNVQMAQATTSVSGYLSSSDWTTFNGKQSHSTELDGVSALALTGIVQRTGAGAYTGLGVSAPLSVSAGNLIISNISAGLITTGTLSTGVLPGTVVLDGGNPTAGAMNIGTNTAQTLNLGTNGVSRLNIDATGTIGMSGTLLMKPTTSNAGTTIDYINGNLQSTSNSCGAFNLYNMKDGGSYSFAVKGATSATCAFMAYSDAGTTALTVHMPTDHAATLASKHTLYTFLVMGADVYVSWMPGL